MLFHLEKLVEFVKNMEKTICKTKICEECGLPFAVIVPTKENIRTNPNYQKKQKCIFVLIIIALKEYLSFTKTNGGLGSINNINILKNEN